MINKWYLSASAVMALTTAVHVFAGGPEIYAPLRASGIDVVQMSVWSVVWHAITWILMILALMAGFAASRDNLAIVGFAAAISTGFAVLFVAYGSVDLGELWSMPQWIVFLIFPGLLAMGTRS